MCFKSVNIFQMQYHCLVASCHGTSAFSPLSSSGEFLSLDIPTVCPGPGKHFIFVLVLLSCVAWQLRVFLFRTCNQWLIRLQANKVSNWSWLHFWGTREIRSPKLIPTGGPHAVIVNSSKSFPHPAFGASYQ